MTDTRNLGRRQRRMLYEMAYYGDGQWPREWRMSYDDRTVLYSLFRRGLVTSYGIYAALTKTGRKQVTL